MGRKRLSPLVTMNCTICEKVFTRTQKELLRSKTYSELGTSTCSNPCRWEQDRRKTTEEKFWALVNKEPGQGPKGDCWEWQGLRSSNGYGEFVWRAKKLEWGIDSPYGKLLTHRLAYGLATGSSPKDLWILHSCDNPPCCNPAHLRPGTAKDNADDRVGRNRHSKGERTGNSIFSDEEATSIKIHLLAGYTPEALKSILPLNGRPVNNFQKSYHWKWLDIKKDDPRVEALRPAAKEYMENRPTAKGRPLTVVKVKEIKTLLAKGVYLATIAEKYGCSISMVSAIKTGRTWRDA